MGSVGFDDHLTDSSLASILFASARFGGDCAAGAYQQIVNNIQKKFRHTVIKHARLSVTSAEI